MRSIHEPIEVCLDPLGQPSSWRWRARVWRVLRVLDRWVLQARWWSTPERRDYLLVEAEPDGGASADADADAGGLCAFEIYRRRLRGADHAAHDAWILARVLH